MKAPLKISLLLNLVLGGLLVFVLRRGSDLGSAGDPTVAARQEIPVEQGSEAIPPVTRMTDAKQDATPATATSQAPARARRPVLEVTEASMPLVFQDIDPAALNLSSGQLQAIDNLQQWFVNEVGGLGQDPNDPAYKERWLKAQSQMDDMTRGMLGVNAFQRYQLAARAAQQNGAP
jgi:hypothetical protein